MIQPTAQLTPKEMTDFYVRCLKELGYEALIDKDGDISFIRDGATFLLILNDGDPRYFRVIFPKFWVAPTAEDLNKAYRHAVEATMKTRVAKIFFVERTAYCSAEIFLTKIEDAKLLLPRCMQAALVGARAYLDELAAQSTPPAQG